jgi:prevent-host-death family protein
MAYQARPVGKRGLLDERYDQSPEAMTTPGILIIGVRELSKRTSDVIRTVEQTATPVIITRHGRPVVTMVPPTSEQRTAFVLANAPRFVQAMEQTEREAAEGSLETLDELRQELSRGGKAKRSAARKPRSSGNQATKGAAAKSAARRAR